MEIYVIKSMKEDSLLVNKKTNKNDVILIVISPKSVGTMTS